MLRVDEVSVTTTAGSRRQAPLKVDPATDELISRASRRTLARRCHAQTPVPLKTLVRIPIATLKRTADIQPPARDF
ncbi:hypothetical protein E7Y31_02760 [Candidatus Frankia alpina]|uniref:Uncharacterized protein n=1 Tax=Candidatus Frankia alpina TaxID=2699483 RepID=A0A4S5ETV6_9ACTN|nr:hypothetical protein E7Y31_02760 [Candidatus Frankia alpina]